jgi:hypothetical protein
MILNVEYCLIFLAGVVGALCSDILKDNCLELPKKIDGQFYLGFLGGAIIGGIAGLTIDGSVTTAFMGGFTGKAVIESLLKKQACS